MARIKKSRTTTASISLEDVDSQIASLKQQIMDLQNQRIAALREALDNAERSSAEYARELGMDSPSPRATVSRGRGKKKEIPSAPAKKGGKGKARKAALPKEERLEAIKKLVAAAGSAGISARKVATTAGMNYVTVLKDLASSNLFKQAGEKRDSRYYMK